MSIFASASGTDIACLFSMKFLICLSLAFVFMTAQAVAIVSDGNDLQIPSEIDSRLCILQFTREPGAGDRLSGIILGTNIVLSVGHSFFFNDSVQIKCSSDKRSKITRSRKKQRHPEFDYVHHPRSQSEWSKYDFSIIRTETPFFPNLNILTNHLDAKRLIEDGECTMFGFGSLDFPGLRSSKPVGMKVPREIVSVSSNHIAVKYSGSPRTIAGDSGGPVLCKHNNEMTLIGLLQYAGVSKRDGQTSPLVVIELIRPEINAWIQSL
jgi:hypothetical protein